MRRLIPLLLIALLALPAVAGAATLQRYRIAWSDKSGSTRSGATVNLYVPSTWDALRRTDDRHLSFHEGSRSCRYSVTFTSLLASGTDQTPAERVAAALPAAANRLLDAGTRGSAAAWRVIHPASDDGRVHLKALRVDRREVAPGQFAWRETLVSAVSRKGSECHSGTYRAVLGPQIGDALATATGRAFTFVERS